MTRPNSGVPELPQPLRPSKANVAASGEFGELGAGASLEDERRNDDRPLSHTRFSAPPQVRGDSWRSTSGEAYGGPGHGLTGDKVQVNIANLPLPAFINEVYGNLLHLSFDIAPDLKKKKDLVTLRIGDPKAPDELYEIAGQVLLDYGVAVIERGGVLHFARSKDVPSGQPPLISSGRTLPDVPVGNRPIFQLLPLHYVRPSDVQNWLTRIYKGFGVEIYQDASGNGIVLKGTPALVSQAIDAVHVLDQPKMRGRVSLRIEPAFKSPKQLADALIKVLDAEGIFASDRTDRGAVMVLPLDDAGLVLVFAPDHELLSHIRQWATELDQPRETGDQGRLFYWPVKNTSAKELAKTLVQLIGDITVDITDTRAVTSPRIAGAEGKDAPPRIQIKRRDSQGKPKLVVDESRNALLFYGQPDVWARLLQVIRQMDVPAKQVLIEVTVAEVTLNEDDQFGVEWLAAGDLNNSWDYSFGTLGGLGVTEASRGLRFVMAKAGDTRIVLNALAADKRVNILSTPRLMVRSGATAKMEVGTEVPIVTSQSTATDLPASSTLNPSILQNIQYRKTGVLLDITPIVYAGERVDLEIDQEISQAQQNTTSGLDSPTILNRSVTTSLTLRDGGSVLLAGLISTDRSGSSEGIPLLMDIPVLGKAFRTDVTQSQRTELVILIIPYVINNADEAEAITTSFRERLTNPAPEPLPFRKFLGGS